MTAQATPAVRLEEALTGPDPLELLWALGKEGSPELARGVYERYLVASRAQRRYLASMLAYWNGPGADAVVLRLLDGRTGRDAAELLHAAVRRKLRVPDADLQRLLADERTMTPAVEAAGLSGNLALAPVLGAMLDDPGHRIAAVLALGRIGASDWAMRIATRLPDLEGRHHQAFTVALEFLADPRVVLVLLDELQRSPHGVSDLHHALRCLTGRDPLVELMPDPAMQADAYRQAWSRLDLTGPARPRVLGIAVTDPTRAGFALDDGLGLIEIDYDLPEGSGWPRWDRSLRLAGKPLYNIGPTCDTCETTIRLIGWPEPHVAAAAAELRRHLSDVAELSDEMFHAAVPLLTGLRSGHYGVFLLDLDLERVADPRASWWDRRLAARGKLRWGPARQPSWPGCEHFQLRRPIPTPVATYGVVMPSQPLSSLSSETIATSREAINAGARPAALLLGWTEQRTMSDYDGAPCERHLASVILDGHHKLAAYTELQTRARVILITRIEDNPGTYQNRQGPLPEILAPLLGGLLP